MEEKEILFNLTIRSTVKTVNDMTFKCPNYWSVATLKQFINTHHKSAIHIYKLESWSLMYIGKVLKEDEIVSEIIKRVFLLINNKIIFNFTENCK